MTRSSLSMLERYANTMAITVRVAIFVHAHIHAHVQTKIVRRRFKSFDDSITLCEQVKITKRETPDSPEITIRELHKGDFFGEKALLG